MARSTYGDLEVNKLLREGRHLIVKAEFVLSNALCRKDKVTLPLLRTLHDDLVSWCENRVIHIEGTAGLDLKSPTRVTWSATSIRPVCPQNINQELLP